MHFYLLFGQILIFLLPCITQDDYSHEKRHDGAHCALFPKARFLQQSSPLLSPVLMIKVFTTQRYYKFTKPSNKQAKIRPFSPHHCGQRFSAGSSITAPPSPSPWPALLLPHHRGQRFSAGSSKTSPLLYLFIFSYYEFPWYLNILQSLIPYFRRTSEMLLGMSADNVIIGGVQVHYIEENTLDA